MQRAITMRHLLTHTAGFSYGFEPETHPINKMYDRVWRAMDPEKTLSDLMEAMLRLPLIMFPEPANIEAGTFCFSKITMANYFYLYLWLYLLICSLNFSNKRDQRFILQVAEVRVCFLWIFSSCIFFSCIFSS